MGTILSTNVGASRPVPVARGRVRRSGIDKQPVDGIVVRAPGAKWGGLGSGVVGDFIGNPEHHGGDDQAVYAFAHEELEYWSSELGRELVSGAFGENLTTVGVAVDEALIDEVWRVGAAVLRVAGPRIPCGTFAGHMQVRGWLPRFVAHARSGAYLRVLEPGEIRPGDAIEVVSRPAHAVTVPVAFRAWYSDPAAVAAIRESGCGSEAFRAEFGARGL